MLDGQQVAGVAWVWLGELPSTMTVIGGAVALAGVAVATRPARARRR